MRVFVGGIRSASTGTEEVQVTGNWAASAGRFSGVSERELSGLRLKIERVLLIFVSTLFDIDGTLKRYVGSLVHFDGSPRISRY